MFFILTIGIVDYKFVVGEISFALLYLRFFFLFSSNFKTVITLMYWLVLSTCLCIWFDFLIYVFDRNGTWLSKLYPVDFFQTLRRFFHVKNISVFICDCCCHFLLFLLFIDSCKFGELFSLHTLVILVVELFPL